MGFKVKISWISSAAPESKPFKLILEPGPGGGSFVSYGKTEVHLFNAVRAPSIAHEIGHVLGHPDHFYTVWHPEICQYVVQTMQEDIMSDASNGSVTPAEWKDMDLAYPYIM
jgi:hypothetical protein